MAFDYLSKTDIPIAQECQAVTPPGRVQAHASVKPVLRVVSTSRDAVRRMEISVRLSENEDAKDEDSDESDSVKLAEYVDQAMNSCERLRVDLSPVFDALNDQSMPRDFFVLLRDYLCTLEVAVIARAHSITGEIAGPAANDNDDDGLETRRNVHILQKKSSFRSAAERYADIIDVKNRSLAIDKLRTVRFFVESKLAL